MTIAACYVSPEGVVLGADSTSTYNGGPEPRYYNNSQKVFELGLNATMGVVTWGLGGLAFNSYRRLFATLADDIEKNPPVNMQTVMDKWIDLFWPDYDTSALLNQFRTISGKKPFDPHAAAPDPAARTQQEERQLASATVALQVGFCIGGYVTSDRTPNAYSVIFAPGAGKPTATQAQPGFNFWGAPNMISRLILGYDQGLQAAIKASGKWNGSDSELGTLLTQFTLQHPFTLPIRDSIDFVYSCIYSTIKALKFSSLSQICGGPIEVAVITADRPFRWVCHKAWDSAIREGHHEPQHHHE